MKTRRLQDYSPNSITETMPLVPLTPPTTDGEEDSQAVSPLSTAIHVLSTEATALSELAQLYTSNEIARSGFERAVNEISSAVDCNGKLIVVGMGKSGKVGEKIVATMNSLGITSVFLHPSEALHGDMGMIRSHDVILMLSYSGSTRELMELAGHLNPELPLIAMTSHINPEDCPLTPRQNSILLPAPIPQAEEAAFGVSAPTISTTVAMALGDALALSVAKEVHGHGAKQVQRAFRNNHPARPTIPH